MQLSANKEIAGIACSWVSDLQVHHGVREGGIGYYAELVTMNQTTDYFGGDLV